jgi:hypothetical protein
MKFETNGSERKESSGVSPAAMSARLQVDIGNFEILIDGTKVGEIFVEYDPAYNNDATRMIEHWVLFSSYVGPRANQPDVSLRFHYQGLYASASDFLVWARGVNGARYIRAVCHETTP